MAAYATQLAVPMPNGDNAIVEILSEVDSSKTTIKLSVPPTTVLLPHEKRVPQDDRLCLAVIAIDILNNFVGNRGNVKNGDLDVAFDNIEIEHLTLSGINAVTAQLGRLRSEHDVEEADKPYHVPTRLVTPEDLLPIVKGSFDGWFKWVSNEPRLLMTMALCARHAAYQKSLENSPYWEQYQDLRKNNAKAWMCDWDVYGRLLRFPVYSQKIAKEVCALFARLNTADISMKGLKTNFLRDPELPVLATYQFHNPEEYVNNTASDVFNPMRKFHTIQMSAFFTDYEVFNITELRSSNLGRVVLEREGFQNMLHYRLAYALDIDYVATIFIHNEVGQNKTKYFSDVTKTLQAIDRLKEVNFEPEVTVSTNSAQHQLDVMARVLKDVLVGAGVVDPNAVPSYMELCAAGDDYANWKSQEDPELNGFIPIQDELPGEDGDYIIRMLCDSIPGKSFGIYDIVAWHNTRGHFGNETRNDRCVTHWKPIGIIVEDQKNANT